MPSVLAVGNGSAFVIAGWLYHESSPIASMQVRVRDRVTPVRSHSVPRVDVYRASGHGTAADRNAYTSGFWCVAPVDPVEDAVGAWVVLEAETEGGATFEQPIAHTTLVPGPSRPRDGGRVSSGLVAICMTTHNPPLELFSRQIESIRSQTHGRWRCLISDDQSDPATFEQVERIVAHDARFEVHRTPDRLGFYFNFESVLGRVPAAASYVALADQDDVWAPHKLATLVETLEHDDAVLAYSDQRIVDSDGEVLSPTFWQERQNYWTGLRRLLAGNTVTGAGSLFRASLLDSLLPFPPRLRVSYHDHWLAVVAAANGGLTYVDLPLYDYVQHADQVLGHAVAKQHSGHGQRLRDTLLRWEDHYFDRVLLQQLYATVLRTRAGSDGAVDRRMLDRLSEAETAPATLDFVVRALAEHERETLGHHREAACGLAWRLWVRHIQGRQPTRNLRRGLHRSGGLVTYDLTRAEVHR